MKSNKDSKQMLFEMMVKLNPSMKFKLNEANAGINPKYTHFAVLKSSNKIVNGWDYNGHEQSELNQFKVDYFFNDITDMDINPKLVAIYTKRTLESKGINPLDTNNWFKFEAEGWKDRNELN